MATASNIYVTAEYDNSTLATGGGTTTVKLSLTNPTDFSSVPIEVQTTGFNPAVSEEITLSTSGKAYTLTYPAKSNFLSVVTFYISLPSSEPVALAGWEDLRIIYKYQSGIIGGETGSIEIDDTTVIGATEESASVSYIATNITTSTLKVTSSESWLTATLDTSNSVINLSCSKNITLSSRKATVTITGDDLSGTQIGASTIVTQNAYSVTSANYTGDYLCYMGDDGVEHKGVAVGWRGGDLEGIDLAEVFHYDSVMLFSAEDTPSGKPGFVGVVKYGSDNYLYHAMEILLSCLAPQAIASAIDATGVLSVGNLSHFASINTDNIEEIMLAKIKP